ncbi:B-cell receptor CD22 [Larus michahellis]|uniref:B-cell receptor CD22 n=1 Tax=Larus michahellis TaxID=119627 RepID=UPI003D9BE2BB
MRFFVVFFFLIPGSLSPCPDPPVTGPKEMVVKSGSCLYISCRYDLCQAGPDAQLTQLDWIHRPDYDQESRKFLGRTVSQLPKSPEDNRGGCDLTLPHVGPQNAGKYGLRLVAKPKRRNHKELLWMHHVFVNVTDTAPAPHLWPPPAPLAQGRRATFGCWVPPACPGEAGTLVWEGPATKTPGAFKEDWTPPANVTPHPAVGTRFTFDPFWYHDETRLNCTLQGADGRTISRASRLLRVDHAPRDVVVEVTPPSPVREGEEVTLSCRDSAKPPSETYSWSLGGQVLPHSGAQLLLKPVRGEDGGSYSCGATNAVGTAQSRPVQLEVHCEWGKMAAPGGARGRRGGLTGPYWSLLVHSGPYWSVLVHSGLYWSVLVCTGPSWPVVVRTGPYWPTVVYTGPYCPSQPPPTAP